MKIKKYTNCKLKIYLEDEFEIYFDWIKTNIHLYNNFIEKNYSNDNS